MVGAALLIFGVLHRALFSAFLDFFDFGQGALPRTLCNNSTRRPECGFTAPEGIIEFLLARHCLAEGGGN